MFAPGLSTGWGVENGLGRERSAEATEQGWNREGVCVRERESRREMERDKEGETEGSIQKPSRATFRNAQLPGREAR